MNKTSIEWTDYTSNLIRYRDPEGRSVHGCIKVSAGCANCYASAWSARGLEYGVSKTTIGRIKRGTMWQPKGSALREWPS